MPPFWAYVDSTPPDTVDTGAFRRNVLQREPHLYGAVLEIPDEARLTEYLVEVGRLVPRMREIEPLFLADYATALAATRRALGVPQRPVESYLAPSF